jgi:hypothetical protein
LRLRVFARKKKIQEPRDKKLEPFAELDFFAPVRRGGQVSAALRAKIKMLENEPSLLAL